MATSTKIEWTDATWNPATGCTKVSPGCKHCYAESMAYRFAGMNGYPERPHHFDVTLRPERLGEPLKWRKPRRVFVCSMSDLFHDDVPASYINAVFAVMQRSPRHTFQVLTKRAQRMRDWVTKTGEIAEFRWPLPNVWLGTTCENQEQADKRIPYLLQTSAVVRFVSVEPMLGPVDLQPWRIQQLNWVICGGESGPGARPMHPDWARSLRDQCADAGVPFFFKQWGAWVPQHDFATKDNIIEPVCLRVGKKKAGRLLDGREWNEYPEVRA